jgi:hypothetical protein
LFLALFLSFKAYKMAEQKFAVGQLVEFESRTSHPRKPAGPYQIVRILPLEDGSSRSYRIKSVAEPFERIAREYEILAVELTEAEIFQAKTMPTPAPRPATSKRS